jgi:hypothetical protein
MPIHGDAAGLTRRINAVRSQRYEDAVVPSIRSDGMCGAGRMRASPGDRRHIEGRHQLEHFLIARIDHAEDRCALRISRATDVERPQRARRGSRVRPMVASMADRRLSSRRMVAERPRRRPAIITSPAPV